MNAESLRGGEKLRIGVVTTPIGNEMGEIFVANFVKILEPLSEEIFLITENFSGKSTSKIHIIQKAKIEKPFIIHSFPVRLVKFFLTQLSQCVNLIKVSSRISIVAFYLGGSLQVLPALCAKLLGNKTILFYFGSRRTHKIKYAGKLFGLGGTIFSGIIRILETITILLSDKVAVESESVIEFAGIGRYRNKIFTGGARYIDTHLFTIKRNLENRRTLIGYIGNLRPEKGVYNFAKAIPIVIKEHSNVEFLIGGNGPLLDKITEELRSSNTGDRVELTRYIPHQEVPRYLNELKLLVLPSHTEGVPGIVQEAMACGTPVLATPVGGVPDLIKDGKTGFILESNSPESIAKGILRALAYPRLDEIAMNAHNFIEREYAYEVMVEKRRSAFAELG